MVKIKKEKSYVVYFMSYDGKRIFYDKKNDVYSVALRRDGTDDFFATLDDAFNAIDNRKNKK